MNKAADVHQHPWQKTLRANQELWKTMDQPRGPWQTTTTSHHSWLFCPFSLLKSAEDNRHPQASQMNKSCGNTPWQTPGSAKVLALSWVCFCPLFGLYNWPSHLKFKFALGLTVQWKNTEKVNGPNECWISQFIDGHSFSVSILIYCSLGMDFKYSKSLL